MLLDTTPSKDREPGGFTLVELLTVVAILAVLAAILIPVTNAILANSGMSRNLSNLRSLQGANMLYAMDNNGKYVPVGTFDETGAYRNHWHRNPEFAPVYLGVADIYAWPEELISPRATLRDADGHLMIERSYGYNYTGLGGYGVPDTSRNATLNQVFQPTKTLAFADALDWQIQINGANKYSGVEEVSNLNNNSAIAYRYNGKAGVVFFDGHTKMLSRDEVVGNRELWTIREVE